MTVALENVHLPTTWQKSELMFRNNGLLHHNAIIATAYCPKRNAGFILLRLNPLGQRKLPIVISLSRMLCFGRVSASACALNVSAALQDASTGNQL